MSRLLSSLPLFSGCTTLICYCGTLGSCCCDDHFISYNIRNKMDIPREMLFLGLPVESWWLERIWCSSSLVFFGVWCLMRSPLHQWWADRMSVGRPALLLIARKGCSDLWSWWSSQKTFTCPSEKLFDVTTLGSFLTGAIIKQVLSSSGCAPLPNFSHRHKLRMCNMFEMLVLSVLRDGKD